MGLRLVAARRDDGVLRDMSQQAVAAPALIALRCVYGVADPDGDATFCPVYAVSLPVAQPTSIVARPLPSLPGQVLRVRQVTPRPKLKRPDGLPGWL